MSEIKLFLVVKFPDNATVNLLEQALNEADDFRGLEKQLKEKFNIDTEALFVGAKSFPICLNSGTTDDGLWIYMSNGIYSHYQFWDDFKNVLVKLGANYLVTEGFNDQASVYYSEALVNGEVHTIYETGIGGGHDEEILAAVESDAGYDCFSRLFKEGKIGLEQYKKLVINLNI
jgi:hypothetical protein